MLLREETPTTVLRSMWLRCVPTSLRLIRLTVSRILILSWPKQINLPIFWYTLMKHTVKVMEYSIRIFLLFIWIYVNIKQIIVVLNRNSVSLIIIICAPLLEDEVAFVVLLLYLLLLLLLSLLFLSLLLLLLGWLCPRKILPSALRWIKEEGDEK